MRAYLFEPVRRIRKPNRNAIMRCYSAEALDSLISERNSAVGDGGR